MEIKLPHRGRGPVFPVYNPSREEIAGNLINSNLAHTRSWTFGWLCFCVRDHSIKSNAALDSGIFKTGPQTFASYRWLHFVHSIVGFEEKVAPGHHVSDYVAGVTRHRCNVFGRQLVAPDVHLTHISDKGFVCAEVFAESILFLTEHKQTSSRNDLKVKQVKRTD